MENKVKLRVFKRETTEKFNEIISKIRKTKDKTFINEIDPYDYNQSQIISIFHLYLFQTDHLSNQYKLFLNFVNGL